METTHRIRIDMLRKGVPPVVDAMQFDAFARVVEIELYSNGVAWNPPDGASFAVSYGKPDGKRGFYETLPDGTSAISVEGNVVSATIAPQALTVAGTVLAALVMRSANTDRLSSFPFEIHVTADPSAGTTDSEDYFNPGAAANAVLFTPQTLTPAQQAQARKNIGIANTGSTPVAYLYNGVELPALPNWDTETYPYAVITLRESIGLYYLSVHKAIHYFEGLPPERYLQFGDSTPGTALLYTWQEGMAAWELFDKDNWSFSVDRDDPTKDIALWTHGFDLLYSDETLYVVASDPVPVYPEGGGGADWSPVVIDLDTYGGGTFETSVTAVVLQLLNNGGGRQQNVPMGSLFSDLNTARPIRVQLSFPFSSTNIAKVIVDGVSTVRFDDYVESLYANVLFAGMGDGIVSVLVHINCNGIISLSILTPGADNSAIVADMEAILNAEY